jgi:hypothetical protein
MVPTKTPMTMTSPVASTTTLYALALLMPVPAKALLQVFAHVAPPLVLELVLLDAAAVVEELAVVASEAELAPVLLLVAVGFDVPPPSLVLLLDDLTAVLPQAAANASATNTVRSCTSPPTRRSRAREVDERRHLLSRSG